MEPGGGGEGAAKRQGLSSSDAAAAAAGEDRLSALPDDVLVLILLKLGTRAAAQTSVLSHRWRRIWALLPVLSFPSPPEPHRLRDALDGHEVLLRELRVGADGATAEALAVWLPAAARRVSGDLTLKTYDPVDDAREEDDGEEAAAQRGSFEFPCFEKATTVSFFLGFEGLAVPLTGAFARLTGLHLKNCVWLHGPGDLGDAVSSPRCPCLRMLTVRNARGLRDLAIHSKSILLMDLWDLQSLSRLTVVVPALKELTVGLCFLKNPLVADISAPLLTKLEWDDQYDPSSVHLGKLAHLQWLGTNYYLVYGGFLHNQSCLSLLQRFEGIRTLFLTLMHVEGIENYDYMMEDMAVLPHVTFLRLMVVTNGHAFEASTFHVLRLCTGIRSLTLQLFATESEGIENFDYMMEDMAVLPDVTFLRLLVSANGHAFAASAFQVLRLCTGIRRLLLSLIDTVSNEYGPNFNKIWKAKLPLKTKIFMWLVSHDAILTKDNLIRRKWKGIESCSFCNERESGQHLFFDCPTAKYIWSLLAYTLKADCRPSNPEQYWIWVSKYIPQAPSVHTVGLAAVYWAIWKTRNSVCFENKRLKSPTEIVGLMCSFLTYWAGLMKDLKQQVIQGAEVLKTAALLFHAQDQQTRVHEDRQIVPYVG